MGARSHGQLKKERKRLPSAWVKASQGGSKPVKTAQVRQVRSRPVKAGQAEILRFSLPRRNACGAGFQGIHQTWALTPEANLGTSVSPYLQCGTRPVKAGQGGSSWRFFRPSLPLRERKWDRVFQSSRAQSCLIVFQKNCGERGLQGYRVH